MLLRNSEFKRIYAVIYVLGVSFKLAMHGCTDEQEEEASRNVVDSTKNQTSKQEAGDKPDDQLGSAIQESLERMSHGNNLL